MPSIPKSPPPDAESSAKAAKSTPSVLKAIKVLADSQRLRILLLLEREEASVAELQEILSAGQSRISTQLSLLKQAGLVEDRRQGKNVMYRAARELPASLRGLLRDGETEIPEAEQDAEALGLVLRQRADRMRAYFDELAGKFGRQYVPGRSWQGLAEMLLALLPPLEIADLGAGEGAFTQLLARRAKRVIAVDNSERMVQVASELANRNGFTNIDFRVGDLEAPPISQASVDLALLSQSLHHALHPERALAAAWRILRDGGRIAVLDLKKHHFEEARELYADHWLGFGAAELEAMLRRAGFENVQVATVHREAEHPHFETLLAVAWKPQLPA
ncbi:MAG: metalloregulator ArsR/SmtB family transcription factor [Bryobacterales bacterium]|nr:metalloregulator ArsR/SmtB family transcription factor [Bryobacterales bacterium]